MVKRALMAGVLTKGRRKPLRLSMPQHSVGVVASRLLIMLVLAMAIVACETRSYQQDAEFSNWFLAAGTRCNQRYPPFALYGDKERGNFMGTVYSAYRGKISPDDLVARLSQAYPNHTGHASCLAKALPR